MTYPVRECVCVIQLKTLSNKIDTCAAVVWTLRTITPRGIYGFNSSRFGRRGIPKTALFEYNINKNGVNEAFKLN